MSQGCETVCTGGGGDHDLTRAISTVAVVQASTMT
jgi:hypothetical protein